MASVEEKRDEYVPVAEVEVDSVEPHHSIFVLKGIGADRADYQIEMHLDFPIDRRTETVLAEILSQSELRILRKAVTPLRGRGSQPQRSKPIA